MAGAHLLEIGDYSCYPPSSIIKEDNNMKQTIINSFIDKSVKAPSYEPNELTRKNFGDWITANPLGTYKEWKEYLELLVEGGE